MKSKYKIVCKKCNKEKKGTIHSKKKEEDFIWTKADGKCECGGSYTLIEKKFL